MGKASDARLRANDKYDKKAYDKVLLRLRSDSSLNKSVLQAAADKAAGGSLNGFIVKAITDAVCAVLTPEEREAARIASDHQEESKD